MKIAVITPYHEPNIDWLHQGHQSVLDQRHPCRQIFVAAGQPIDLIDQLDADHIRLPGAHRDHGNTARAIGGITAANQGFDGICFLDPDHWLEPDHAHHLAALHLKTGADVCIATRHLHQLSGEPLGACFESDGRKPTDINGFFLTRKAFPALSVWHAMAPGLHPVGHLVAWHQIERLHLKTAHLQEPTVCYRSSFGKHYEHFKLPWANGVTVKSEDQKAIALFERLRIKAVSGEVSEAVPLPLDGDDGMLPRAIQPDFLLISVIGMDGEARDRLLDWMVEDCRSKGRTPVFITDDLDLAPWIERQLLIEHLPNVERQALLTPDLDWDLYLDRRLMQLKRKWRTADIVDLGNSLSRLHDLPPKGGPPAPPSESGMLEQQG